MFFVYAPNKGVNFEREKYKNPFVYQNTLYSQLLGKRIELYQPVPFLRNASGQRADYRLVLSEKKQALYGNIPWNRNMDAEIKVNSQTITPYSRWLSPSVFYIPSSPQQKEVTVTLAARNQLGIRDEQFYSLDLDKLEHTTKKISANAVHNVFFNGPELRCTVNGKRGQSLFLSIPYHKGWHIQRNGKTIQPELFADCMMTIPLLEGNNKIEMKFTIPLLYTGITLSCAGICLLLFLHQYSKKKRKASPNTR